MDAPPTPLVDPGIDGKFTQRGGFTPRPGPGEKRCDLKTTGTGVVRGGELDPTTRPEARVGEGGKIERALLAVHNAGRRPLAGFARTGLVSPARLPPVMVLRSTAVLSDRRAMFPGSMEIGTARCLGRVGTNLPRG